MECVWVLCYVISLSIAERCLEYKHTSLHDVQLPPQDTVHANFPYNVPLIITCRGMQNILAGKSAGGAAAKAADWGRATAAAGATATAPAAAHSPLRGCLAVAFGAHSEADMC
jgi:hypothetical protein